MLRILLTGLALTMPAAVFAQIAAAPAPAAPAAPAPAPAPAATPAATPAPILAVPQAAATAPAADAAAIPTPAIAAPAPTQPKDYLPNLFDVTVVETWDTLNVRESPDGQAKVIGTLPATAKGIELLARDSTGKWGKVNVGERSGWAALRFLKPQASVWKAQALPQSLNCSGTEPFWGLRASKSGMVFTEPDQADRTLELRKVMDRGLEGEPTRGVIAGDAKGRVTAFLRPAQCTDGMSDQGYALAVSVILDGQDMPSRMLTGCCRIAR